MSVLETLGAVPVINAGGRLTALGGSTLSTAVTDAMAEAGRGYCDVADLKRRAGAWIAVRCGADDAYVTTGAAAGIALMVAAVVAGTDPVRVASLPDSVEPNRILILGGHMIDFGAPLEQMVRMGGGRPLAVGSVNRATAAELRARLAAGAVAAVLFVRSHHAFQRDMPDLPTVVDAARQAGVPVLVDAAAEEDLRASIAAGAALVAYSGGKAFEGPTSGFVAGRSDLIDGCRAQEAGIGRPMKVGKETIAGLVAALAAHAHRDPAAEEARRDAIVSTLIEGLGSVDGLRVDREADEARPSIVRVGMALAPEAGFALPELVAALRGGTPPVYVRTHHLAEGRITLDPRPLEPAEAEVVVRRVREEAARLRHAGRD